MNDITLAFDLDGTLVDTAPDLCAAINHCLDYCDQPRIEEDALRPLIAHGAKSMLSHALGPKAQMLTDSEYSELIERFFRYYSQNIARHSLPYDGVPETLERFQKAGAKLVVCTNKSERLAKDLLESLALSQFFVGVAGRDTFEVCKPHPEHLLGTIRMAGGMKSRAVMIGDSKVDVATARAAGVPIIAVTFGYSEIPVDELRADELVERFCELERTVRPLLCHGPNC